MRAEKYSAMFVLVTQSRVGRSRRGHLVKYGVVAAFFYKEGFRRRRVLLSWEVSVEKYKSCRICTLPLYSNSRDSVQLALPLRQSHQLHIQHEGGKLATFLSLPSIYWHICICTLFNGSNSQPSLTGASVFDDTWMRSHGLTYYDFSHVKFM